jgi:hypothetical protein
MVNVCGGTTAAIALENGFEVPVPYAVSGP